ncbi:MAG: DNA polymerase III subunit alpha [Lentisphaeria bacterium]|nr:DNA polymerase III subunit alpha [Lentisphaeria bacterium]
MWAICHTYYSLQVGVVRPVAWVRAAAERGYTALAVADLNGLYGAVEFHRAATEHGIKPMIGALLELRRAVVCTVLVRSAVGYRQLCRLLTARHVRSRFSLAAAAAEGGIDDLVFLAREGEALRELAAVVSPGMLYRLPPAPGGSSSPQPTLWQPLPAPFPEASVPDAWLLGDEDRPAFECLAAVRRLSHRHLHLAADGAGAILPPARQWRAEHPLQQTADAIEEACTFSFAFGKPLLPRIALPGKTTSEDHLRCLCREGMQRRYPPAAARRPEAEHRLQREIEVIAGNGFADYFLYVNEIIGFARRQGIPVGVRGSAASAIVAYLLGFTECCPIEHDLYFERFMNPGRRDCPDIDVDVADNRRDEVIDFCYRRWGPDHVAMVATVQFYRAQGAMREAARLLGLDAAAFDRIERGETSCPELFRIAGLLTGRPRHLGIHCGGLLITPCPITDMTPLARAAKGILISHYEKDQAEAIGLVKMDLLGNSALSVIDGALRWLDRDGMACHEPGPRYDYKVNRLFRQGDTLGVYQCESPGMRQLCRALAPRSPKETAAALSLIRPGPASAGMKNAFIRRRLHLDPVEYLHPAMAQFLGDTYGVMLYQEDVMKVAVTLAGYTMAEADSLRRAVSKTRSTEAFAKEKNRFVFSKSRAAGLPAPQAEKIWDAVSRFASYAYCKAHATVYARLAWITARLKAHYPREFYAAILNSHKSMYPPRVFVWDAMRHGIPVLPPDVSRSNADWTPLRNGVLAGLSILRGLTGKSLERMLRQRAAEPFRGLTDLLSRVPFQGGEIEVLILVGACRAWGTREQLFRELRAFGRRGLQPVFLAEQPLGPLPSLTVSQLEFTGIPFGTHPIDLLPHQDCCPATDMPRFVHRPVCMLGLLDAVKHTRAKAAADTEEQRLMSFVTLEDATGMFDAVLFPETHRRLAGLFTHAGPYRVYGTVAEQWGTYTLELHEAEPVSPGGWEAGASLGGPEARGEPRLRRPDPAEALGRRRGLPPFSAAGVPSSIAVPRAIGAGP